MKVIDLLNKMANGEELPRLIKYNDIQFEFNDIAIDYIEVNGAARKLFTYYLDNLHDSLQDEIEIIEDPKEDEFEEIELIDNRVAFETIDLEKDISIEHKWDYTDVIQNTKINELIANQNKIIRELKDNKENE